MADPFLLSTQYQERLDNSTKALEDIPRYVMEGLKIPGMISQNRILGIRAQEAQMELSSNEQLQSMIDDPAGFARKFGDLKTAKEMREYMASHSAISITPAGQRIMGVWDKIATLKEDSEQHSVQRISDLEYAKKDAGFRMKHGLPQNATAEQRATATADDNVEEFLKYANTFGKDGSQVDVQPTDFDVNGNWIPGAKLRLLKSAPVSEVIKSREAIAADQLSSREQVEFLRSQFRQEGFDLKEKLTNAQINLLKARETAFKEGRNFAPDTTTRKIQEAEKRGINFSEQEIDDIYRISSGLKSRATSAPTEGKFIDTHLNAVKRQDMVDGIERSDRQRIDYLKGLYVATYGDPSKEPSAAHAPKSGVRKFNPQTGELE